MWCYYFIEGGPTGIEEQFRGSPYYGYNVFLNHRLATAELTAESSAARQMRATRRAVLDFPYYMQSADSVRRLYPELATAPRTGICLSHHSRSVIEDVELTALKEIGPVFTEWTDITDIHVAELQSTYFLVHPESRPSAGLALIEAVSAGCLALAPSHRLWGFPELVVPELDFDSFEHLLSVLERLEADPDFAQRCRSEQRRRVQDWCYANPAKNLEMLFEAFRTSTATSRRQRQAEKRARVQAAFHRAAMRLVRRALRGHAVKA
jgi:hypothetical protein